VLAGGRSQQCSVRSERKKRESNGTPEMPSLSVLLRFRCLFIKNSAGKTLFQSARKRLRRFVLASSSTNAPLYTKLIRTTVNFFPLVYFGCQCRSIRDCTVPISPSTQARRAAMAKKRKAKAAAKKTKKRRKKK
jgi:hypothetical protein